MAVQMLYQHELGGSTLEEVLARFDPRAVFAAVVEDFVDPAESESEDANPCRSTPTRSTKGPSRTPESSFEESWSTWTRSMR